MQALILATSLGDLAQIGALVIALIAGPIEVLRKRIARLSAEVDVAKVEVAGWRQSMVLSRRLAVAMKNATDWNLGLIDRIWAERTNEVDRARAMDVAQRMSEKFERISNELALLSPDAGERQAAGRALAEGLGTIDSLSAFEVARGLWADDSELDRLCKRLSGRLNGAKAGGRLPARATVSSSVGGKPSRKGKKKQRRKKSAPKSEGGLQDAVGDEGQPAD
jgi:hypothetical protein